MKNIKFLIAIAMITVTAAAHAAGEILVPFKPGGSSSRIAQVLNPIFEKENVASNFKFMNNCNTVKANLNTNPSVYIWASDLDCPAPADTLSDRNFISILNWQPLYFCGTNTDLSSYNSGSFRMGVNTGLIYQDLGKQIINKINPNIKIIEYNNTAAIKTALITKEIDMSLSTSGLELASENLVSCYAVSATTSIQDLKTLTSLVGNTPEATFSFVTWISAHNMPAADVVKFRRTVQNAINDPTYIELISNKMRRQLPDSSMHQQITRITQSLSK